MPLMTPDEIEQAFKQNQSSGGVPADAWIPEKAGDTLVGYCVRRNMREGDYGTYPIVTVVTEQAELLALHCAGSALNGNLDKGGDWKGLIADKDPQPGDYVGFRYDGQAEPKKKGQQGAKRWTVFVRRGPYRECEQLLDQAAARIANDPTADEYAARWALERLQATKGEPFSDDPFQDED